MELLQQQVDLQVQAVEAMDTDCWNLGTLLGLVVASMPPHCPAPVHGPAGLLDPTRHPTAGPHLALGEDLFFCFWCLLPARASGPAPALVPPPLSPAACPGSTRAWSHSSQQWRQDPTLVLLAMDSPWQRGRCPNWRTSGHRCTGGRPPLAAHAAVCAPMG